MGIVFLNCFLRSPSWLFHDKQSKRIPLIPPHTIIDNNTLIGLCEVFGDKFGHKLSDEYKRYDYNFARPSDTSSGLAIAYPTKYKLIVNNFTPYTDAKLPDSLVNKGFMHCVFQCNDCKKKTTVLVTHLQSSYGENKQSIKKYNRYREIQQNQLTELKQYITKHRIKKYILMGDFNINKNENDELFNFMIKLFDYQDKINLLPTVSTFPQTREIIDYIFIKTPNDKHINKTNTKQLTKTKTKQLPDDVNYISDHNAITLI